MINTTNAVDNVDSAGFESMILGTSSYDDDQTMIITTDASIGVLGIQQIWKKPLTIHVLKFLWPLVQK
jgi:hypothetical protein